MVVPEEARHSRKIEDNDTSGYEKEKPVYFNLDDLNKTVDNKLENEGAAEALNYLNKRYAESKHGYYIFDSGIINVGFDLWLDRKLEYLRNQLLIEKAKELSNTNNAN